ncbi:MAG: 3-deoxy-7-phosphoheptulonate synthase, partial [Pseudomonadota bacterium]|nr:3-deoxy-7-phosphoheptulonate synthase [Pseudomonadota bacterium]
MSTVDNKFPGKDLTDDDIAGKIPLVAKKSPDHKTRFTCAGIEFGGDLIPVLAGPNLAETEDMIMECARAMKAAGAHFLRAGCFKPLTFPYRSEKFYETR